MWCETKHILSRFCIHRCALVSLFVWHVLYFSFVVKHIDLVFQTGPCVKIWAWYASWISITASSNRSQDFITSVPWASVRHTNKCRLVILALCHTFWQPENGRNKTIIMINAVNKNILFSVQAQFHQKTPLQTNSMLDYWHTCTWAYSNHKRAMNSRTFSL